MSAPTVDASFDPGPHQPFRAGEDAIDLFAFLDPGSIGLSPLPAGEGEERLMTHRVGSVAALIGFARVGDYCGPDSAARLADVAWLEPRARRHAELIQWAMKRSPVFPVPFGTLYSSLESLTTFMQAHEAPIKSFLSVAADHEEWELRAAARLNNPAVLDRLAQKAWPEWEQLSKGARYLRLCRDKAALAAFGRAEAAAAASRLVARLRPRVTSIRERSAAGSEFAARYALLLPRSNIAAVRALESEAGAEPPDEFVVLTYSGPLPPFSFRPSLELPMKGHI